MLHRSFDIERINALANHPEIRPFVGGDISERLDLTPAIGNTRNVWLIGDHGGFLYQWTSPGCYEVHTMIEPTGRGAWASAAASASLRAMSQGFSAKQVWTRIKPDQLHVISYAMAAGLSPCGNELFDIGCGPESYNLYEKWF